MPRRRQDHLHVDASARHGREGLLARRHHPQGELVGVGTLAELRDQVAAGGSLEEVFLKVTGAEDEHDDGYAAAEAGPA